MLPPTPTQLYLVSIRFRRKITLLRLLLFLIDLKSTISQRRVQGFQTGADSIHRRGRGHSFFLKEEAD